MMSPAVVRPAIERLAEVRTFDAKPNPLKLLVSKQLLMFDLRNLLCQILLALSRTQDHAGKG